MALPYDERRVDGTGIPFDSQQSRVTLSVTLTRTLLRTANQIFSLRFVDRPHHDKLLGVL